MASMLTTKDNPNDPRKDFKAWYTWDVAHGYNTSAYLARVLAIADDLPDELEARYIDQAMQEIVDMYNGEVYEMLEIEDEKEPESDLEKTA